MLYIDVFRLERIIIRLYLKPYSYTDKMLAAIHHGLTNSIVFNTQQLNPAHTYTWCGRKVMRLATLCTNRQRCCLPLHMAVRLTPAVDSVQV